LGIGILKSIEGSIKKIDQDLELKIQKRNVQNQAVIPIP
jgi:hypothetical protein